MDLNELNRHIVELLAKRPSLSGIGLGNANELAQQQLDKLREAGEQMKQMIADIRRDQADNEARAAAASASPHPASVPEPIPAPMDLAPEPKPLPAGEFHMVRARTARQVLETYSASTEVVARADGESTPRQLFDRLVRDERHEDALQFLVYALPKRAAVLWGCVCLRVVRTPAELPIVQVQAWRAVAEWILKRDEPTRRAAEQPAREATALQPAGALAWAVFGHGGSLSGPDLPAIEPPPHMTHQAVHGALRQMLGSSTETMREFLRLGCHIATSRIHHPPGSKTVEFAPLAADHTPVRDLFVRLLGELGVDAPEFRRHEPTSLGEIWQDWL